MDRMLDMNYTALKRLLNTTSDSWLGFTCCGHVGTEDAIRGMKGITG